jgi:transposase-like protein/IS1 family transposase
MRVCPNCRGMLIKYGFLKKEKTQRYKCKKCNRFCSDAAKRTFGTLRSSRKTILLVLKLLTEGMSVRSTSRVANCHRDTVLRILKHAGRRSYDLLQRKLQDVKVNHVEVDETWTYVLKKSKFDINPETDTNPWGDFYIFLGMESESKLLFMPVIGKRSENTTWRFADMLRKSTAGRFQLTSDGYRPYKNAIRTELGDRVDFAQFYKEYNMLQANKKMQNFNRKFKDSQHRFVVRSGQPEKTRITTSHIERLNRSLRTANRRFNRKTICFSKDEENMAYSVYLFAAHYNFCNVHGTHKVTPTMAAGIETEAWTIEDLLNPASLL